MANCTDANCLHPAAAHTYQNNGKPGTIGSGCPRCVGQALRCKGLALAVPLCGYCSDPLADHKGIGQSCHGACVPTASRCTGGTW